MSDLSKIESHFNQRFRHWDIRLPPADIGQRQRGKLVQAGWVIWYLFGADEQGEYLDYYATHRMSGDEHRRLRANGGRECLPSLQWAFASSEDPAEARRLEADFYAENRRIAALLEAKGFACQGDEPAATLINRHLLTQPTP